MYQAFNLNIPCGMRFSIVPMAGYYLGLSCLAIDSQNNLLIGELVKKVVR